MLKRKQTKHIYIYIYMYIYITKNNIYIYKVTKTNGNNIFHKSNQKKTTKMPITNIQRKTTKIN